MKDPVSTPSRTACDGSDRHPLSAGLQISEAVATGATRADVELNGIVLDDIKRDFACGEVDPDRESVRASRNHGLDTLTAFQTTNLSAVDQHGIATKSIPSAGQ